MDRNGGQLQWLYCKLLTVWDKWNTAIAVSNSPRGMDQYWNIYVSCSLVQEKAYLQAEESYKLSVGIHSLRITWNKPEGLILETFWSSDVHKGHAPSRRTHFIVLHQPQATLVLRGLSYLRWVALIWRHGLTFPSYGTFCTAYDRLLSWRQSMFPWR